MEDTTEDTFGLVDRIRRGHWVGREREMAEATALWQRVVQGEAQVFSLRGEPGVGKTRFVRELASKASLEGASVLTGECYAEGSAPYAPLAQMFREFYENFPQATIELPDKILNNLLPILPRSPQFIENLSDLKIDSKAERQQVIEGLIAFCSELSSRNPLLLFIDDAHWGDTDTLYLLRNLARRVRRLPVLIVMTYREAELESAPVLQEILVDLNHDRMVLQLKLERFTRDETGNLLAAMFEEVITPEFLEGIFRQTEGNPFFIEEVCKSLVEAGQLSFKDGRWHRPEMAEIRIPQTVRAALQDRLQKLPRAAQDALRMAAILGGDFDFETLKQACDLDEETLITALESAVRAQLIVEPKTVQAAGLRFSFVHVLIPTTLRESIIHVRRRRLHLRAARAIEAVHPDNFEHLAYQFNEAGDIEHARQFYIRAGDRAQRVAPGEAARFYQAALDRWPDDDQLARAEIMARLGYC
jgi:predicted ATPase